MSVRLHRLRPMLRVAFALVASVVVLKFAPDIQGQTPRDDKSSKFEGTIEVGARAVDIQGGHTAKFEEVRDVPKAHLSRPKVFF